MIITVTMNPAIDRTVETGEFIRGGLNRIQRVTMDAGGKGINVSKTLKALGTDSVAVGLAGGSTGRVILQQLKEYGIKADFVETQGETRTNTKVVEKDGTVTELNEAGARVSPEEVRKILQKIEDCADEQSLFVLSGSIPAGMCSDIYRVLTEKIHGKGGKVLLDADGELLKNAVEALPDILKINHLEIAGYFGKEEETDEQALTEMGKRLLEKGIETVVITRGARGALFLRKEGCLSCSGLKVEVHSTVGAGDAMAAALALGMEQRLAFKETVRLCMAVSAGAVTTAGTKPPSGELVKELARRVQIRE